MSKKFWIGVLAVFVLAYIAKKVFIADSPEEMGLAGNSVSNNSAKIWGVNAFKDKHGEITSDQYLYNRSRIVGTFSNSATNNSPLNVGLLISSPGDISIQLYEYGRNNPVKAHSPEIYNVYLKDKNGDKQEFSGTNYSDRISFENTESWKIHEAFMIGGPVRFYIELAEDATTNYEFVIENTTGYDTLITTIQ